MSGVDPALDPAPRQHILQKATHGVKPPRLSLVTKDAVESLAPRRPMTLFQRFLRALAVVDISSSSDNLMLQM